MPDALAVTLRTRARESGRASSNKICAEAPAITAAWLTQKLKEKIATIDWKAAAADVERFLGTSERASLELWSERFFLSKTEQLAGSSG